MGVINNQVRIDELQRQIDAGGGGGGGTATIEVKEFTNVIKSAIINNVTHNVNKGDAYVFGNVVMFTPINTPVLDIDWSNVPQVFGITLNFSDDFFLKYDIAGSIAAVGKITVYNDSMNMADVFAQVSVAPTTLNPYLFLQITIQRESIPENFKVAGVHCNSIVLPAIIVAEKKV